MIVNAMTAPGIRPEEKDGNGGEKRLSAQAFSPPSRHWQSRLLVAFVVPACAAMVGFYAAQNWNPHTWIALAFSLLFGLAAWLARAATPFAAVAGGILAAAMILSGGRAGSVGWLHSALLPLLALLLLTFAATRFGKPRKQRLGVAQDARGRNAAQVAANLGAAGLLGSAILTLSILKSILEQAWQAKGTVPPGTAPAHPSHLATLCAIMLIAALAEATADTVSSELGEVLGGEPRLITTGKRVPPGTDGAISLAGTAAGVAGAAVIVLAAVPTMEPSPRGALAAMTGACGGLFFDSLLGATAERKGWLNNDAVNFLSTLAAALLALAIA